MNPYSEFNRPVEHSSRANYSSLQLARNPDSETFVDNEPIEDRLDELAADFVDRYRRGECPPIAEYADQNPDLADEIRDTFPAIAEMEGLKVQIEQSQQPAARRGMVSGHLPLSKLGDFRIIREIGRGGMGVVYEAEQMSLGRRVAIKALPLLSVSQPELVKRFQREARTAARLHHTNIVPVFGVGEADGFHYYVMQLIDGIGLDSTMDDNADTAADSIASQLATEFHDVNQVTNEEPISEKESAAIESAIPDYSNTARIARPHLSEVTDPQPSSSPLKELVDDNSTSLSLPSLSRLQDGNGETKTSVKGTASSTDQAGASAADQMPDIRTSTGDACVEGVATVSRSAGKRDSLDLKQIIGIGINAADALDYAHAQGTLHRDIKPGNLMLDRDGVAWVTDFGLAKAMEGDDITHSENVVGTVRYMAPEQFRGRTDARSDIYSLGLTLYELITRKRAWSATNRSSLINEIMDGELKPLRQVVPHVPQDIETIVLKATASDVQHRYQTAGELAEDLRRYASDRPILARRAGPVEKLWRWSRRNPVVATLSLATIFSLTMFAGAAAIGYTAERQQRERAEATSGLALEALDRIFERFAPGESIAASSQSLDSENTAGTKHAALSPEAARLLSGMLEFYERLASQADDAPELVLKCAQARQRVGDIYQRLGKYDAAINSYRMAIIEYDDLAAHEGADPVGNLAMIKAGLLNGIGSCQLMLARQEESQLSHKAAMNLLNGLTASVQQLPEVRYELARTYSLLARRLRPGESINTGQFSEFARETEHQDQPPPRPQSFNSGPLSQPPPRPLPRTDNSERRQHLEEAIALLEPLVKESPDTARYRFLLALCLRESSGRQESGLAPKLNQACELLETLVDQYPDMPEYRLALAESYAKVEFNPRRMRPADAEVAEASLTMAAQHARQLMEEHPTVPAFTSSLVHIYGRLAMVQERHAEQTFGRNHRLLMMEAERNLRSAVELQNSLVRREPEVVTFHLWAARFRNSIARMLRHQDRLDESRQMSEYAIDRLTECPTSQDDIAACAETMAQLYRELGVTLKDLGYVEDAVDAMLSAEEHFDIVAAERTRQRSGDLSFQ